MNCASRFSWRFDDTIGLLIGDNRVAGVNLETFERFRLLGVANSPSHHVNVVRRLMNARP
jgi:hypothetical protein